MSHPNPLASTAAILEELKRHPGGIRATAMSKIMGRSMQSPLSRLYAYRVIDRTLSPGRNVHVIEYLYRTKLPRITAPAAAADTDTDQRANAPISVEG